ncbi:hypothetical protein RIVERRIDER_96 [Xanthomonas phage RiverRider]|uniref:Uncharacterized protein n=1 Tax=Xanthomonas phage RiverRider TaxID=2108116 RepID=A0A2P1JUX9_9CAUD|nr:hypothetical protein HWB58_gp39 [Xanthomonas phage RiverRider]AVO23177.1 hypothetical protein RIVERRIDER_96 [Xanthomonas phage RiverRider]
MKTEFEMIEEKHEADMALTKHQVMELTAKSIMWGCLGLASILISIALFTQV